MTKTDYRFTLALMIKANMTTRSMKMSGRQITYSMRKPEEKESDNLHMKKNPMQMIFMV